MSCACLIRFYVQPMLWLVTIAHLPQVFGVNVVGYVPEYRFNGFDWDKAVRHTTHLVLFSLQPTEEGDLVGLDNMRSQLQPQSQLRAALDEADRRTKILVTVGGAGRSDAFSKVAGSKKLRKRLANRLAAFMQEFPILSGVDFDWQVPTTPDQWRDLGRLANEVRSVIGTRGGTKGGDGPIVTMTFHPLSGSVEKFASLRSKASDKSFVDMFDMCHAMTYSLMDPSGRHNSGRIDVETLKEWKVGGLPLNKLTLGIPFFGVKKEGSPKTYEQIVEAEPRLLQDIGIDSTKDGYTFVNGNTAAEKVALAAREGLAGVMLWELGQDVKGESQNLLRHIWDAAESRSSPGFFGFEFGETHIFGLLTFLVGGYYTVQVLSLAWQKGWGQQVPTAASAEAGRQKAESSAEPNDRKKDS